MSFIWSKSVAFLASALLLTGAVAVSGSRYAADKPMAAGPHSEGKAPPSVCKYGGESGTQQDAIDYCAPILQCQAPKKTDCRKGTTGQGWICRCK
jgi:hypothetical protein